MTYVDLVELDPVGDVDHSLAPVIFCHGVPDDDLIFTPYFNLFPNRRIFVIRFPNKSTNPTNVPSLFEMTRDVYYEEFAAHLAWLLKTFGRIALFAHDFGATNCWRYLREERVDSAKIDFFVSCSVGSSMRYDVWEHGFRAFLWLYAFVFSLTYYYEKMLCLAPSNKRKHDSIAEIAVGWIYKSFAGLPSYLANPRSCDGVHYWYGFANFIKFPFEFVGCRRAFELFRFGGEFVDFTFPVAYVRAVDDRIASTHAFEETLKSRDDCRILVLDPSARHWFLYTHVDVVRQELVAFLRVLQR